MDTGTLERVANWSPDRVPTVDPCDTGTDPRNGPSAGIPHGGTFGHGPGRLPGRGRMQYSVVGSGMYVVVRLGLVCFPLTSLFATLGRVYRCLFDRDLASD